MTVLKSCLIDRVEIPYELLAKTDLSEGKLLALVEEKCEEHARRINANRLCVYHQLDYQCYRVDFIMDIVDLGCPVQVT